MKVGSAGTADAQQEGTLDPILRTAWERFIQYDTAALRLKNNHIRLRAVVLVLSFVASLMAVAMGFILPGDVRNFDHAYPFIYLLIPLGLWSVTRWGFRGNREKLLAYARDVQRQRELAESDREQPQERRRVQRLHAVAIVQSWIYRVWLALLIVLEVILLIWAWDTVIQLGGIAVVEGLRLILFALPLISAGIMAYAARFTPSLLWVRYRHVTEMIRRQLYLYRLRAGDYATLDQETQRKRKLLEHLAEIERGENNGDTDNDKPEAMLPVTIFETPREYLADDAELIRRIKVAKYDQDNGFQPLTLEDYLKFRVDPMYQWYTARSHNEYGAMRRWQVVALIIGGAGSLLAYLGHEAWIAVTTSAAVTVGALANLMLYGRTYLLYIRAAEDLRSRLIEKTKQRRIINVGRNR